MTLNRAFGEPASAALSEATHRERFGCLLIGFMVVSGVDSWLIALVLFFVSVGSAKWFTLRVESCGRRQIDRRSIQCRLNS
jgi:hypothetical protein